MKTRCDRFFGLGPLFEGEPGPPSGDPAPGAPPAAPPAAPPSGGGAPAAGQPEQTVPYERFAQVNGEYQKLLKAEQDRQADEMKKKGEHEQLAEREKAARVAAEERALRIARRAVFVGAAAGKVTSADAAAKLAMADGDLDKIEVDDDGNAKDATAVGKLVDELVKRYEFLKPGTSRSDFGQPAGGNGGSPGGPEPKDARGMIAAGFGTGEPRRR